MSYFRAIAFISAVIGILEHFGSLLPARIVAVKVGKIDFTQKLVDQVTSIFSIPESFFISNLMIQSKFLNQNFLESIAYGP